MQHSFLTTDDESNYGRDLIDFSQRAAFQAVAPTLQAIRQDNAALAQQLARERRHRLDQEVAAAVPDFRNIDADPAWHRFLLTVDPLNGVIRQQLLNSAIAAGDAARVIAFFRGFQAEERAAGHASHAPVAPGRSRSAPRAPHGARVYTRPEIAQLYEQHRKGLLTGPEWERQEEDTIAATRENRVNAYPWIGK